MAAGTETAEDTAEEGGGGTGLRSGEVCAGGFGLETGGAGMRGKG